ncbi:tyrosine-type recombinase/integrase [Trichormus variabilis]|uniref:Tyrosine recombinase XerC n=1 Tax=Trichormus variabilis SAG 1403-4b TaxID=447716 RepID=A0A3S1IG13_ANAVA|nr:tyrosine-type recombinase/integrase [Trichormus variabilis]MBD2628126.1 tyrosine-type recombinase/integrase [Trichormus variabilis FACHB-164]RUS96849.1 tyrosine recombinase XerC [Trichormus variabilis SAG 1403-4b]
MITLAALATAFLDRPGLAENTLRSYQSTLMPLLQEYGRWSIEIINKQVMLAYLNHLTDVSYTTHHRHQAVITALFNFAVDLGYLKSNPVAGLKRRKPNREQGEHASEEAVRYLTSHQLSILYQVIKKDARLSALVRLLHSSGARIAEVLALNLEQIDFKSRKFQVVGKGNKQRWCFYSEAAQKSLNNYLKYYRYPTHPALFTAQQPKTLVVSRLSYRMAHKSWTSLIGNTTELQEVRLHDLRHTFATERVGLMGIEELRALMGHESIETTLRYQKVTPQRAEEVAHNAFNNLPSFGE